MTGMERMRDRGLGFEVDKLTNSIKNILTGETFATELVGLRKDDAKFIQKSEWLFDWVREMANENREVYKLTTRENPSVIQGLISFSDQHDHIFIHLLESASFNIGRKKMYRGVAENLVAFVCKRSFEKGYAGFVAFISKTKLIEHYENTLFAKRIWGHRMFLDTQAAYRLVRSYFNEIDEN